MVEVGVDIGEFPTSKKDDIKPSDLESIFVSGKLILMSMKVRTYRADSINSNWFCRTFWRHRPSSTVYVQNCALHGQNTLQSVAII